MYLNNFDSETYDSDDYYLVDLPESQWRNIDKWFDENVSLTSIVMTEHNKIRKTIEKGTRKSLQTGVPSVDAMINGLFPGEVLYIGCAEEKYSAAFGMNIVKSLGIDKRKKIQIFNCGIGEYAYARRIISLYTGIEEIRLSIGEGLSEEELSMIDNCSEKVQKSDISIINTPNISVENICAKINNLNPDEYPELILIDNLCFLTTNQKIKSKSHEQRLVTQKLWNLAKDTKIPIILLGPLSKKRRSMKKYQPSVWDMPAEKLLDNFDKILIVHRSKLGNDKNIINVTTVKNPDGQYGFRKVLFDSDCYRLKVL